MVIVDSKTLHSKFKLFSSTFFVLNSYLSSFSLNIVHTCIHIYKCQISINTHLTESCDLSLPRKIIIIHTTTLTVRERA